MSRQNLEGLERVRELAAAINYVLERKGANQLDAATALADLLLDLFLDMRFHNEPGTVACMQLLARRLQDLAAAPTAQA